MNAHDRPNRRFNFTMFGDIEAQPRKTWLVSRFLGAGEMSCAFGAPGCGKSTIVQDIAFHVAAGLDWHGRRVSQGSVLYVAAERRAVVERRAAALRAHHGIDYAPMAIMGGTIDLRNGKQGAEDVIACARQLELLAGQEAALILIDTFSRVLAGGDENSSKDVGAVIANADRIMQATGAHVMIVHHVPQDGSQRMRGHGALLGACDTTFKVEKLGKARSMTVDKTNDGEEGERIVFELISVEIAFDEEICEATTAPVAIAYEGEAIQPQAPGQKLSRNQQTMFGILYEAGPAGLTTDEWYERAKDAGIGVKRRADLVDCRNALKAKKLIFEGQRGWFVSK